MAARPPTLDECNRALALVRQNFAPTPLATVDGITMKLENRAPTGAFKVRGAVAACHAARAAGHDRVVAASAGNHGKGMAWAGRRLGVEVVVVVPPDCPAVKREAMERDAHVIVCDTPGYDAAEHRARMLAAEQALPFVSPFDDTHVMAGNGGTVALELAEQVGDGIDLLVPVGGGGLVSGILSVRRALGLDWNVIAVQSAASPAFATSLHDRHVHLTWPATTTLAEGLEGGAGETSVVLALDQEIECMLVSEKEIARAMLDLRDRLGENIEGSAAVVQAAHRRRAGTRPRVGVLTGGNVASATLDRLRATIG